MEKLESLIVGTVTFLAATLTVAVALFLALDAMPCRWFGSSLEGSCGYVAVSIYVLGGIPLSIGLGVMSAFFVLRYERPPETGSTSTPPTPHQPRTDIGRDG